MKQHINDIISKYNSKSFHRIINGDVKLKSYIQDYIKLHQLENISEAIYCIHHNILPPKCGCGKKALFNTFNKGYRKFCDSTCPEKGKSHSKKLETFWIENPNIKKTMLENKKKTNLKKYGFENAIKNTDVRNKMISTNLEKYGVEYALQSKEIKDKIKATIQANYGVEFPFQSKQIQEKSAKTFEKTKNTIKEKYNRNNIAQLHFSDETYNFLQNREEFEKSLKESSIPELEEKYNISRELILSYHDRYGLDIISTRARSSYEEEIAQFLIENNISFVRNYNKLCSPLQIDFYIEEHKLAIEFNGLYWHSEFSGKKSRQYHRSKYKKCRDQNIQLLTIFEDEWNEHSTIIKSKILHLCRKTKNIIGARKIKIEYCDDPDIINNFLDNHHIQGKPGHYSFALIGKYKNEIISAVTLKKIKDEEYDMTRYCINQHSSYPGLFSKFLSVIKQNDKISSIITFADLRWSTGDIYKKTGFELVLETVPSYSCTDYITRRHKFNFRKSILERKFGLDIEGKTETDLLKELKLDRIWDCGKLKFELKFEK